MPEQAIYERQNLINDLEIPQSRLSSRLWRHGLLDALYFLPCQE